MSGRRPYPNEAEPTSRNLTTARLLGVLVATGLRLEWDGTNVDAGEDGTMTSRIDCADPGPDTARLLTGLAIRCALAVFEPPGTGFDERLCVAEFLIVNLGDEALILVPDTTTSALRALRLLEQGLAAAERVKVAAWEAKERLRPVPTGDA